MDLIIATGDRWLKFQDQFYKIIEAGLEKGKPYAKTEPSNTELEEEIKTRLLKDNGLKVYLAEGYVYLPED